jgi:hypothetical protein
MGFLADSALFVLSSDHLYTCGEEYISQFA